MEIKHQIRQAVSITLKLAVAIVVATTVVAILQAVAGP